MKLWPCWPSSYPLWVRHPYLQTESGADTQSPKPLLLMWLIVYKPNYKNWRHFSCCLFPKVIRFGKWIMLVLFYLCFLSHVPWVGLACLSSDSYWSASWGLVMAVWLWGGCCPQCSFPVSALYLESFPGRWRRRVPTLPEVLCHLQWVGDQGMWALQLLLKSFEPKWRAASLRDPRALLAQQYCPFSWVPWGDLPGLSTSASCCCFDKKTVTLDCVREEHQARWFSLRHFIRVQLVSR